MKRLQLALIACGVLATAAMASTARAGDCGAVVITGNGGCPGYVVEQAIPTAYVQCERPVQVVPTAYVQCERPVQVVERPAQVVVVSQPVERQVRYRETETYYQRTVQYETTEPVCALPRRVQYVAYSY